MTDVPVTTGTVDVPSRPSGWHVVAHARLADEALAILSLTSDAGAGLTAWWDGARGVDEHGAAS